MAVSMSSSEDLSFGDDSLCSELTRDIKHLYEDIITNKYLDRLRSLNWKFRKVSVDILKGLLSGDDYIVENCDPGISEECGPLPVPLGKQIVILRTEYEDIMKDIWRPVICFICLPSSVKETVSFRLYAQNAFKFYPGLENVSGEGHPHVQYFSIETKSKVETLISEYLESLVEPKHHFSRVIFVVIGHGSKRGTVLTKEDDSEDWFHKDELIKYIEDEIIKNELAIPYVEIIFAVCHSHIMSGIININNLSVTKLTSPSDPNTTCVNAKFPAKHPEQVICIDLKLYVDTFTREYNDVVNRPVSTLPVNDPCIPVTVEDNQEE